MEPRLWIALVLLVAAAVAAWLIERRRPDPPAASAGGVPEQLDRGDFADAHKPWLVVLFSSATCESCADVAAKIEPLASDLVAVQDVEHARDRDLHRRYGIEAVPLTLVADPEGVVRSAFLGRVTATDLWAAVAEVREPGTSSERHGGGLLEG